MTRRQALLAVGGSAALLAAVPLGWSVYTGLRFPSDRTAEGCYMRLALAFAKSRLADCFPYLETTSQHALYGIHDFRKRAVERIRASFEEPERSRLLEDYEPEAAAASPPELWVVMATRRGWDTRLRKDLSGIRSVEVVGDRATVVTAQGTRYPFRRGDDGLWGLTLFSAELVTHRDRSKHDLVMVEKAADDFDRARNAR